MKRILAPVVIAVLLATSVNGLAQDPVAVQADIKGCGPADEQFDLRSPTPPSSPHPPFPGEAAIYFIDLVRAVRVGLDGKWVGALSWSSYAELAVAPGVHHLCNRRQGNHRPLNSAALYGLDAVAGESYYFLVGSGGTGFDEINTDEARLLIATAKFGLRLKKMSAAANGRSAKKISAGGQK